MTTPLRAALDAVLPPERILDRDLDRAALASDASVYRLIPQVVVRPASVDEVRGLFAVSHHTDTPLVFRGAGTSLSGQAITDGVLVDLSQHWDRIEVLDQGARVRAQPGALGGALNHRLRPFGRKIGPDPASLERCTLGGILANNASGMCCGTALNAYHTLDHLRCVLPSGDVLDTREPLPPDLARGLLALRQRVLDDADLTAKIRAKYRIKNTTGYALNALLDFDDPREVLAHLLVGSEGTLAFIAEATLRTVPAAAHAATGLLVFASVEDAADAVAPLASHCAAVELFDTASLRAVATHPAAPAELPPDAAALLIELQAETADALHDLRAQVAPELARLPTVGAVTLRTDPAARAALWALRKGLFPAVGATKASGESVIIEDVAVPPERLAPAVRDLRALFERHGYADAIVFGHAKDGNCHFVLKQAFDTEADVARYDDFMQDLVRLVVDDHGGALKAEHGTGRNVAPFVRAEWGDAAYAIFRDLKALLDPRHLLNPGVILNDDPRAHLQHLKSLPTIEPEADRCIECGFCEPVCPSRRLTLTPRQRIVLRRELARPDSPLDHTAIRRDARYSFDATCAADGLCQTRCPVAIDTGALVTRLRSTPSWAPALRHLEPLARLAATLAPHPLPRPAPPRPQPGTDLVLFPTCTSRLLGRSGDDALGPLAVRLARRAGVSLRVPRVPAGTCCGLALRSKGLPEDALRAETLAWLDDVTEGGRLPVWVDASSCALHLRDAPLRTLDTTEVLRDWLLPRLDPRPVPATVAVHPTCATRRLGLEGALIEVAQRCAETVQVPDPLECCGSAGDRGLRHPELPASALRELDVSGCAAGFSTNPTCEVGLTRVSGLRYRSVLALVDAATRAPRALH